MVDPGVGRTPKVPSRCTHSCEPTDLLIDSILVASLLLLVTQFVGVPAPERGTIFEAGRRRNASL